MANGMKSGSGDDPFADEFDASDDEKDEGQEATADADTTAESTKVGASADDIETTTDSPSTSRSSRLPYRYSRDSAKDGRDMVQFFLQSETQRLESQAQTDLETMLDEDVLVLDVREAAYQVALQEHLGDVADQLREWGYDVE